MYMLADAVNYMHDIGYVHFDLKPGNVLLRFEKAISGNSRMISHVKISDFGISMNRESKYHTNTHCWGTLLFMAPERLTQNSIFDHRIDTWALGVILHKILTGQYPYYDMDKEILAKKIVFQKVDFSAAIWETVSI